MRGIFEHLMTEWSGSMALDERSQNDVYMVRSRNTMIDHFFSIKQEENFILRPKHIQSTLILS